MSYRQPPVRSGMITGSIVLIGLVLSFLFGSFNLAIFFLALAVAIFVGGLFSGNPRQLYGSAMGAMWMLMLALFFMTGSWLWFLVGAAISLFLGALMRPIIASLTGTAFFQAMNQPQQQDYQPPAQQPQFAQQQPYYQPPSYQQGYSPTPQQIYEEGGQNYQYPTSSNADYEQPQPNYPQQLPPQQQN
ncbi:MAG TPA: hypothetical protein VH593_08230 [Ktedonobacteraceae bacterium]|jgi:hypothetical protein